MKKNKDEIQVFIIRIHINDILTNADLLFKFAIDSKMNQFKEKVEKLDGFIGVNPGTYWVDLIFENYKDRNDAVKILQKDYKTAAPLIQKTYIEKKYLKVKE